MTLGRYRLAVDQIALPNYQSRLAFDEQLRSVDPRDARSGQIDDVLVANLRDGMAGRLNDAELVELVGSRIERIRRLGNTMAEAGSDEWRTLARAMCISEYEALSRVAARDEGDFAGKPAHPFIADVKSVADELPPVSLKTLLNDCVANRDAIGKDKEASKRWAPVIVDRS